jgi:hypothetical protein
MKKFTTLLLVLLSTTAFSQDYSVENNRSLKRLLSKKRTIENNIKANKRWYAAGEQSQATFVNVAVQYGEQLASVEYAIIDLKEAIDDGKCYECDFWKRYDYSKKVEAIEAADRAEKRRLSDIEKKKQLAKEQAAIKAEKQLNVDKKNAFKTYERLRDLGKQTIEYKSKAISQYEVSKTLTEGGEWHTKKIEMAIEAYNLWSDAYVELIDIIYTKESEFTKEVKLLKKTFPDLFAKLRY